MNQRNTSIDIMKALLVIGMIFDHILTVITIKDQRGPVWEIKLLIDLAAYSGFMFCFGYASYLAYLKNNADLKKMFASAAKIFSGFYIGSFFGLLFYTRQYNLSDFLQVITFAKWMVFCEFLPSFGLAVLITALFRKQLPFIIERSGITFIVCGVLFLTTYIPSYISLSPRWGLVLGVPGNSAVTFPVIPYFALYIIGMYFAQHEIKPSVWLLFASLGGLVVYYAYRNNFGVPMRFPPSLAWIVSSLPFVLLFYAGSGLIDKYSLIRSIFSPIGQNTLFYLILSDMILFSLVGATHLRIGLLPSILLTFAIVGISYFLTKLIRVSSASNSQRQTAVEQPQKTG